jgi:peptidoglycan/xylan/chitin deacetylase (PgdA/CDA1 family)
MKASRRVTIGLSAGLTILGGAPAHAESVLVAKAEQTASVGAGQVPRLSALEPLRTRSPRPSALEAPRVRVLPWNGHRAALTLTFDDSSPSEATEAVPELDERGVKGTFFVTTKNLEEAANDALWAQAEREGHELGNHTVDHCHGPDLGRGRCLSARQEVERANRYIQTRLGAPGVYTFAYPFVDQRGGYKRVAESDFLLARAGKGGLVDAEQTPDWYSMDARFIEPTRGETLNDWDGWIDETDAKGKWLVLVFHSILPEEWCEGIPKDSLGAIIDHAKAADDLWIDTFVNVGAYLRAQRMFEAIRPAPREAGFVWKWTLPHHFPPGKAIRVTLDRGTLEQRGARLVPDSSGTYAVALDARSLAWAP